MMITATLRSKYDSEWSSSDYRLITKGEWQWQRKVCNSGATLSRMNFSGYIGRVTIFSWMLNTTACCLVVELGLWLGLGLNLVSGWSMVLLLSVVLRLDAVNFRWRCTKENALRANCVLCSCFHEANQPCDPRVTPIYNWQGRTKRPAKRLRVSDRTDPIWPKATQVTAVLLDFRSAYT